MRKHFAIAAIVAVLAGPGMREAATAEPQAGEVLALSGQCFVETAGRRNALKPGDAVHVGDTLDVAAGAKLKLRMSDGSVIAVASGTRLAIADYRLGNGFSVHHQKPGGRASRYVNAASGPRENGEVAFRGISLAIHCNFTTQDEKGTCMPIG